MEDIINKIICGADGTLGTGTKGCIIDMENLAGLGILTPGTKVTDFSRTGLRTLQKEGKLFTIQDLYDATWANEDLQTEASPSRRLKRKTSDSLYEFVAMMTSGIHFQKVLKSIEGKCDIILFDEEENTFGTSRDGSYLKGFSANIMVHAYTPKQGTTAAKTQITVQLQKSVEMDKYNAVITSESAGFSVTEIDGVNQVNLSVVSGLVAASSTIRVKTVLATDNNTFVGGLAAANFLVKVNDATVAGATVTAVPTENAYDIGLGATPLAVDDKVEIVLYDSTGNRRVIEVGAVPDEILYQSKEVVQIAPAA